MFGYFNSIKAERKYNSLLESTYCNQREINIAWRNPDVVPAVLYQLLIISHSVT